jgi:hypothetical protein
MLDWIKARGKSLAAVVVAGLLVVQAAVTDNRIDAAEGLQIAIAVTAAVSVYLVPDLTSFPWAKNATAAVLAALNFAAGAIDGGIVGSEWVGLVLAALGVLGVSVAPAAIHLSRTVLPVRSSAGM